MDTAKCWHRPDRTNIWKDHSPGQVVCDRFGREENTTPSLSRELLHVRTASAGGGNVYYLYRGRLIGGNSLNVLLWWDLLADPPTVPLPFANLHTETASSIGLGSRLCGSRRELRFDWVDNGPHGKVEESDECFNSA